MVSEIEQLSTIGQHPNIVGFVGANIDENNSADPIMILEYMDGGCLQDVLTAKSKNGPWRPPKATSYSWYAPAPVQSIRFASLVLFRSITTEAQ
jgi:serine/threonine protein kinase